MTSSYKLKLILGGASGSGKSTFLHGTPVFDSSIGVSFKSVECMVNEGDSFNFMVWDLKGTQSFQFLYKTFCRGACGALLCFDTTNYDSFKSLPYWINLFREAIDREIPIFLIGTKIDLNKIVVPYDEIEEFIEKNDIMGMFFASAYDTNLNRKAKDAIFKKLIEKIDPDNDISEFIIIKDDEEFIKFAELFSKCPICKKNNHIDSLRTFFKSKNPFSVRLRERLLDLIDESEEFDEIYYNPIQLGIPCCKCYKEIFGNS